MRYIIIYDTLIADAGDVVVARVSILKDPAAVTREAGFFFVGIGMTWVIIALIILFVFLLLLPWLGGLVLIGATFTYLRRIVRYQAGQVTKLRTENDTLRESLRKLEDENSKLQLAHQTVLVENAMLSAKHDRHHDS